MEKDDNKKQLSRREFLAWAAAVAGMLVLPGCEPYAPPPTASRTPRYAPPLPEPVMLPPDNVAYASPVVVEPQVTYVPAAPAPVVMASGGNLNAMSRNTWGASPANPGKMKKMGRVTRITIHHEGSAKPNNDLAPTQVAATLRLIQSQHRKRMGAGDIGYHFIIDRSGTIWQGRDWAYQGAHTSGANSNNLGVMLLGNFEIQQPTAQQLQTLRQLTGSLTRRYGLDPRKDIYGHNDFCNTQCPGRNLKPHVIAMRRGL